MNPAAPGSSSSQRLDIALLLLRVACALVFLYHGSGILFGAFGGPGPQGFAAYKHWPVIMGYLVGAAQVGGALAVLLGLFFRIGTACLVVIMLGAIFTVHLPYGFDVSKGGYEFALTELLIAIALFLSGPGRYSVA